MAVNKDYYEDRTIMGFMYRGLGDSLEAKKTKREASFELLRIISMMMVIVLHYLSKGGLIDIASSDMGEGLTGFWILEAVCLVAVNVFVLISGYFMVNANWSLPKIIGIWCQVFFYSVLGAVIAVIAGIYSLDDLLCLKNILFFLFPGVNGHYWFATSYILLYLISPILVAAIKGIDREKLMLIILVILIPFSFVPSVAPFELVTDDKGNGIVWFICLFMIAGYIRLYGIKFFENRITSVITYILSVALIVFIRAALCIFASQHEGYEHLPTVVTQYNFVFVLLGSISLFYIFKNMNIKDGVVSSLIVKISPFVLGVYLIHEHLTIRYEWPVWFRVSDSLGFLRILHIILTVLIIFSLGIIVDAIRAGIFYLAKKLMIFGLNIYFAKREMWDYLIFGFLATIVNWVAYIICAYSLLIPFIADDMLMKTVSNVIAWVAAVLFAYWTNRTFVFKSTASGFKEVMVEFASFIGARVFSFVVEQGLFFVSLMMNISDIIAKLVIGVVVIILNYIFSKLFIFKKRG